jgi:2-keto-4-pentenoate hydratase/2-oxohepta-3-ene-1,7-dioic acid hydratase in catechol pathway
MRVTRVLLEDEAFYAALQDDSTVRVLGRSIGDPADGRVLDLAAVTFLPPVNPSKIVCVGLNYRDHATETGSAISTAPVAFSKYPSSVIGDGEPIILPASAGDAVDFEAELGVVIGRVTKDADERSALESVYGYTCVNDVSARDAQVADASGCGRRASTRSARSDRGSRRPTRSRIRRPSRSPATSTASDCRTHRPRS